MEEWKEYKLGEVLTIKYGKDHKQLADGDIPIYGSGGIMRYGGRSLYDGPSILIPRKGSLNNVIYADKPFWTVDTMFWSIINDSIANPLFVYYSICKKDFASLNVGSAVPSLTVPVIEDIDILLPSKATQDKVASVLKSLDDKIEVNRRINDNLEQQAQALFKSWFVDFEPFKNGQFVDSELGKIPEGWKIGYLSEIADIIMGQSPNGSTYNENGEGIIFYQDRAEFGTRFPSIRLFTTNPTRIAPANSILISVRAPVGDINITHKECCIGRGLASAVSRTNKSAFLLYTLFSLKSDLDRFNAEGTVFGSINRKTLESLKILIPTNDIISKFEAIVASMDQQILTLHLESENLKILRDTLLPKLMSGERSVIHKENNDD